MDFALILPSVFGLHIYFCFFAGHSKLCGGVAGVTKQVRLTRILEADT